MAQVFSLPHNDNATYTTNLPNNDSNLDFINDGQHATGFTSSGAGNFQLDWEPGFEAFYNRFYMECSNVGAFQLQVGSTYRVVATETQPPIGYNLQRDPYWSDRQFALLEIDGDMTNEQIMRMEVTARRDAAQPVTIYRFYYMNHTLDFEADEDREGFTEIDMDFQQRTSYIFDAIDGSRTRTPLLYNQLKRAVSYTYFRVGNNLGSALLPIIDLYRTSPNFMFAQEFARYPDRVYRAHFANDNMRGAYLSDYKGTGEDLTFTIEED